MANEESTSSPGSPDQPDAEAELSSIDFSTFILSLSTTALYQMGLVEEPGSGERIQPNWTIAQQTIDTLEMLQQKTRGNLEPDEENLFESLLYELRLRFVEVGK